MSTMKPLSPNVMSTTRTKIPVEREVVYRVSSSLCGGSFQVIVKLALCRETSDSNCGCHCNKPPNPLYEDVENEAWHEVGSS